MIHDDKLVKNPFKEGSKAWVYLENCHIDYETGYSRLIDIDILEELGLKTTNGGDWCRSDGPLGKYFNIDRTKDKGKISGVQLLGYKKNSFSSKISKSVREHYKESNCCVLGVGGKYIEIDHKDGRKDDLGLPQNQKYSDFQPMHRNANIAKRQHCKVCKSTNIRFDAKRLGYSVSQWIGKSEYTGNCLGCYWYDPLEFNMRISQSYIKHM
jgi:hypothetical protein